MKKIICIAALLGSTLLVSAQNSNPWPTTGNVGIGTSSPSFLTHIYGGTAATETALFALQSPFANANTGVTMRFVASTNPANVTNSGEIGLTRVATGANMYFRLGDNTNMQTRLSIIGASGNVGIGTTTPSSKLHVKETNATPGFSNVTIENAGALGYEAGINFKGGYTSGSLNSGRIYSLFDGGTGYANARTTIQSMLTGGAYDNTLTVRYGSVGIGTIAPPTGYKLAVNGSVIATAVTVQMYGEWPDYVFKKDYKLLPLTEVKNYIDRNQHLPDMPSEQEIAANGLNLGELSKVLTKKVEELTLYLIEKEKELNVLKARMDKMEKSIENKSL
ncbi:hypothetical protein GWR56_13055 [Mucilaginibacter sp. 14171R-50]|uniref:hypothetical protein n=1 Tax=Mucilaginibacter sp. 14171R-50 TaxID=2703789 RepID=UPI00138C5896|nr:hypothetical protein [Mucilaginibacter sp. 14171R-50]QHS56419.1 hypothetical protein GWR56_13055 [Mucilaginibacter sp. 14171R-50]